MRRPGGIGGPSFPVALLLLQLGSWFAMFSSGADWRGSWRQAIDHGVGTVVITGPLLAGLVAVSYSALRRTTLADVVVSSARPWRGWFGLAIRLWIVAVLSLAIVLIVVTCRARLLDVPTPPRQFVIVPLGVLMLAVHALIGMVIGLRARPRAAPVLAVVISFGLFLLAGSHLAPPSFETGGVTGSMMAEQYRIGGVVALCGFAVASAMALAPWVGWNAERATRRWVISALAGGCIIALAQTTWPDLEARLEPAAVSFRCAGAAPEVCVPADRVGHDLEEISRRMNQLSAPLREAGAALPARWRQGFYGHEDDLSVGALRLDSEAELGGPMRESDMVRSLVSPADCAAFYDATEPVESFHARFRLSSWIAFRNGFGNTKAARPWFSSAKSEAWVRTTYEQLRRCDLDAIRKP